VTESTEFRTVLRGYDPAEVDHRIDELTAALAALTQQRDGLAARVEQLHTESASAGELPNYEHLGARIGQILSLAEKEAAELRGKVHDEIEAHREHAEQYAASAREEADRYVANSRSQADAESARIIEDARKAADEHREGGERAASVRLQEAEAVYEEQRARAAKAAADFETTLAGRRKAAEEEFTQKMAAAQARLDEANDFAEHTRLEAEAARVQAAKEAARLAEDAREKAEQIIGEAKASAERIRADTDRELAAATQRRDSINAQLANVRQMLATLTGTAPFSLAGFGDAEGGAWAESEPESQPENNSETPPETRPESRDDSTDIEALDEEAADDGTDAVGTQGESLAHRRS
jgi:DivIVA domain-containing protein